MDLSAALFWPRAIQEKGVKYLVSESQEGPENDMELVKKINPPGDWSVPPGPPKMDMSDQKR